MEDIRVSSPKCYSSYYPEKEFVKLNNKVATVAKGLDWHVVHHYRLALIVVYLHIKSNVDLRCYTCMTVYQTEH